MEDFLHLTLKPSIFDKEKNLSITPEFIEYDNVRMTKFEIDQMRYGVKSIRGYNFRIGRIYCIDIKSASGDVIKLRLKSLYGIRKNKLGEKYINIIRAISKLFMNEISRSYLQQFSEKNDFELSGITFTQQGIILEKKSPVIPWKDVGTKNYYRYYALFSITDPNKYKALEYINDWNTSVLYSVSRQILKDKNLWQE